MVACAHAPFCVHANLNVYAIGILAHKFSTMYMQMDLDVCVGLSLCMCILCVSVQLMSTYVTSVCVFECVS